MSTDIAAVPPRPTRPPGVKPPAHKPAAVASKATQSKPFSEPVATRYVSPFSSNMIIYMYMCVTFKKYDFIG